MRKSRFSDEQMVAILPGRGTAAEQELLQQLRKGRE